jgi:hypothetical protein
VLSIIGATLLGFLFKSKLAIAKPQSTPRIDHVIGTSILPSGDSIVMVMGNNLENVVGAKLSVQAGETEILIRDPAYLVIRVNPKTPALVGNINLRLSASSGWDRNLDIRLICDPSQFCLDSSRRYQPGSRYRVDRYSDSSRYSVPQRYSGYPYSHAALSDETGPSLMTCCVGEQLL